MHNEEKRANERDCIDKEVRKTIYYLDIHNEEEKGSIIRGWWEDLNNKWNKKKSNERYP